MEDLILRAWNLIHDATGYEQSVVLVLLVIIDTIKGLSWRSQRTSPTVRGLASGKFKMGIALNLVLASLPGVIMAAEHYSHHQVLFVLLSWSVFFSFGFTEIVSIISNSVLAGDKVIIWAVGILNKAMPFLDRWVTSEINNKVVEFEHLTGVDFDVDTTAPHATTSDKDNEAVK